MTTTMTAPSEDDKPTRNVYINRELSWLEFNRRVLQEAQDARTPLMEKLKFLAIVSTNLDEFMGVRVAGLQEQWKIGYDKQDFSGYTPGGLLKRIVRRTKKLVNDQYKTYREMLRQLKREGVLFVDYDDLTVSQRRFVDHYYEDIVFPVLTPMAVDQSRPFPLVHNKGLFLAVVLHKDGEEHDEDDPYFSIVQVPSILPRFIALPGRHNNKKQTFILLEQLIARHIRTLFSGYAPVSVHGFRVTRNADLPLKEEEADDLLEQIEKELRKRRWGMPVRLEVEKGVPAYVLALLSEEFELEEGEGVIEIDGPLDLSFLMRFADSLPQADHLRYKRIEPVYPQWLEEERDMFAALRKRDVLLHHPYESFEPFLDFIDQAAHDPKVLAIKITLYRVSGNSPLIRSLVSAAEAGKQVTVVVELKARFDEERNIAWAKQLEKAGCHVVYGLVGLKTHCKITLVVRQAVDKLERYVHVGTGNYNENTAKLYTDIGLFTADAQFGEDASVLFNEITGYSSPRSWRQFAVAPSDLFNRLRELIRREIVWAQKGKPARLIAKVNSLSNQQIVDELYAASRAGVRIDLIVRGVCCLKPGVPGLSDNIRVISIVDRFLEHSRLFYFHNGGKSEVYVSSADWMTRNLTRRIELMCPVLDKGLQARIKAILEANLRDNVKARVLQPSGGYISAAGGDKEPFRVQFALLEGGSDKQS